VEPFSRTRRVARVAADRTCRTAVLDVETVHDPGGLAGSARDEVDRAVERVRADGLPVRLSPQPRRVRWQQHAVVEAAGLVSLSYGDEPARAVEVRPRPGPAPATAAPAAPADAGGEDRIAWVAVA
jgi:pantothenate synthetase